MCYWVDQKYPLDDRYDEDYDCSSENAVEDYYNTDGAEGPLNDLCPLVKIWPFGCTHEGAPYMEWSDGTNRVKNARIIWKEAERLLTKELKK
jgi:hypothetical protein